MGAACNTDASSHAVEAVAISSASSLPTLLRSDCSNRDSASDATKKEPLVEKQFWVEVRGFGYDCPGLVLDPSDENHAVVLSIGEGTVRDYNVSAHPSKKIEPMDYLMQVNHVSGDPERMEAELRTSGTKRLLIAKPIVTTITVERPLGLVVSHKPGSNSLLLREIGDGSVANWNYANVGKMIKKGDIIVEVNWRKGDAAQLFEDVVDANGDECRLAFARPAPFAHWSHFDQ